MKNEKTKNGCKIEYDSDAQVCIIPNPYMPFNDFFSIVNTYYKLGYKWWLPSDDRCGYILSKNEKD